MFQFYRKSLYFHLKGFVRNSATLKICIPLQHSSSTFALNYSTDFSKKQAFTVNYLISNCGLSPESAVKVSKRVRFATSIKADSVLTIFRNIGLSDSQLHNIIIKEPRLLVCDPVKIILPKIEFFKWKGASSSQLVDIATKSPALFRRSLENRIIPCYDFLNGYFRSDQKTIASLKRSSTLSNYDHKVVNVKLLLENGVLESGIALILFKWPMLLNRNRGEFKMLLQKIKELGFNPSSSAFIPGLCARNCLSNSVWEKKIAEFKRWGLSDDAIYKAFVKQPYCMFISECKIAAKMDFFVNHMGWESVVIANNPTLLTLSLEKRIIPRASVLQYLQSRGLIKNARTLSAFQITEKMFLQKFVNCFEDETPKLLKLYEEKVNNK